MDVVAAQRFALLLVLFGGFLKVSRATQRFSSKANSLGIPLMVLGLVVGTVGFLLAHTATE